MTTRPEDSAVISGVGQSDIGRRLGRDDLDLTIQAMERAVADAGLSFADIDGLCVYPGNYFGIWNAFTGPGVDEVQDALRLELEFLHGGHEGAGPMDAIVTAVLAIAGGYARHVVVYRTLTEGTGRLHGLVPPGSEDPTGWMAWYASQDVTIANLFGLMTDRYFREYVIGREDLAAVALNGRAHASRNERAVYREPLTLDDYLHARMVSTPLCLFDCDVPCDGATAVVVSRADHVADALAHPVRFDAIGVARKGRPTWDQWQHFDEMAQFDAAAQMWSRSEFAPGDIDQAQLYDGFSIEVLVWLEAIGLAPVGEAAAFATPDRIGPGGSLPVNTDGGQLSAGRLHGLGFVHEAVQQLRGVAGAHQQGAPEVVVVGLGGGTVAGSAVLTRAS